MSLIRKIARPLLAASFVYDGVNQLRAPEGHTYLTPAVDAAAKARPELAPLKGQEKLLAQGIAGTQVAAGALFAIGRFPRISSALLVATGSINAYLNFRASEVQDQQEKKRRLTDAVRHASMVGAVTLASVDTDGNPSLAWRAQKLSADLQKKSEKVSKDVKKKTEDVFGN